MSLLVNLKGKLSQFFDEDLRPFVVSLLGKVIGNEVRALKPIVAQAVADLEHEVADAIAAGSLSDLAAAAGNIATHAAREAEAQGIAVGIQSLLTTVSAAITDHPAVANAQPSQ